MISYQMGLDPTQVLKGKIKLLVQDIEDINSFR